MTTRRHESSGKAHSNLRAKGPPRRRRPLRPRRPYEHDLFRGNEDARPKKKKTERREWDDPLPWFRAWDSNEDAARPSKLLARDSGEVINRFATRAELENAVAAPAKAARAMQGLDRPQRRDWSKMPPDAFVAHMATVGKRMVVVREWMYCIPSAGARMVLAEMCFWFGRDPKTQKPRGKIHVRKKQAYIKSSYRSLGMRLGLRKWAVRKYIDKLRKLGAIDVYPTRYENLYRLNVACLHRLFVEWKESNTTEGP